MSAEDALELFLPQSQQDRALAARYDQDRGETTQFLDAMYSQILKRSRASAARGEVVRDAPNPIKETLGAIATLSEPLPAASLAKLLNVRDSEIGQHLSRLHSVVHVPAAMELPTRLFHASLRDFLFDARRSSSSGYWVDETATHARLANSCLRRLDESGTLKRDLCCVVQPGIQRVDLSTQQIATKISPDVAYAYSYWPWHVVNSGQQLCDDGQVHRFLQNHFLHWLEALSWIGKLSSAIAYISSLQSITQENHGTALGAFLEDARRFILQNRYVVDLAPMQIYHSALVFAPMQSVVRNTFLGQVPQLLARLPNVQMYWSAEILKLEGHDDLVTAVAFSPDGQVVASASEDRTVRLWNAATGEQTQKLEGHYRGVTAVAFSSDGQVVASASGDKTVRLWKAATGQQMQCYTSLSRPTRVRFTNDGSALDTDVGLLNLTSPSRPTNTSPSIPNLSIGLASTWLQYNGMDMVWLPHEYRGTCSTTCGGDLVIGQASGTVSFFSFIM